MTFLHFCKLERRIEQNKQFATFKARQLVFERSQ